MPSWLTPHSEPSRKLNLYEKRLGRLRAAVKADEGPAHVAKAAEKIRLAALAVIKAKRALIREYTSRDPDRRQTRHLAEDELRWQTLTVEEIVARHGHPEPLRRQHRSD